MARKVLWFLAACASSLWSWELLIFNPYLGLLAIATSFILYLSLFNPIRKLLLLSLLFISALTVFQIKLTPKDLILSFTPAEKTLARVRTGEYPPYTNFITRRWEERKESAAVSVMIRNFSEVIDPNLYFFASHPRERIGTGEVEKFSYLLIPFFIHGLVMIRKLPGKHNLFLISIPALTTIILGDIKTLGPFAFYPFFASIISLSFFKIGEKIKLWAEKKS